MSTAQASLFDAPPADAPVQAGCGCGAPPRATGARGRGATPRRVHVVELPQPNPAGLRRLTLRYRPLHRWDSWRVVRDAAGARIEVGGRLAQVEDLLIRYFAAVGGFRRARDAVVWAWYEALDDYTPDEVRWAVDAKARSLAAADPAERRAKRAFVPAAERFPALLDRWLEQSPEHQRRIAVAEEGRLRAALDAFQGAADQDLAARAAARAAARQAAQERRAAFWAGLTDGQRTVALRATEQRWRDRCEQWRARADDPALAPVRLGLAVSWASLRWPLEGAKGLAGTAGGMDLSANIGEGRAGSGRPLKRPSTGLLTPLE